MYVDALTLAAVADELRAAIVGGRVQVVLALDPLSVGFEVYAQRRRRYLVASAHPQTARLHLAAERLRRGDDAASPLLLLLRKWVRGARLDDVQQPAFERILRLVFDHPDEGVSTLIVEIMGRHSNIILTDAGGVILDSIKRVGAEVNRYRLILPHQPYVAPPAQDKLPVGEVTELRLRQTLAAGASDGPIWKALVNGLAGVSPLLAREAAFRAFGDAEIACGAIEHVMPLLEALRDLLAPLRGAPWTPSVGLEPEAGDEPTVACFAPYALTHRRRWEAVPSISAAIQRWVEAGAAQGDAYAAARSRLQAALSEAQKRYERQREQLLEQMASLADLEQLRADGELILACGWNLAPGQTELLADLGDGAPARRIAIDPTLSPAENAQAYFRRYQKAKRSRADIPPLLEANELALEQIRQLAVEIDLAANRAELDEVRAEMVELGYIREPAGRRPRARPAQPLRLAGPDETTILVGRNSRQNQQLTFKLASPDDWWLHARGLPGAHVVLRGAGAEPSEASLRRAAELAAYYSGGRRQGRVTVDYTLRRHVRPRAGGGLGQVTYTHARSITVQPRA